MIPLQHNWAILQHICLAIPAKRSFLEILAVFLHKLLIKATGLQIQYYKTFFFISGRHWSFIFHFLYWIFFILLLTRFLAFSELYGLFWSLGCSVHNGVCIFDFHRLISCSCLVLTFVLPPFYVMTFIKHSKILLKDSMDSPLHIWHIPFPKRYTCTHI